MGQVRASGPRVQLVRLQALGLGQQWPLLAVTSHLLKVCEGWWVGRRGWALARKAQPSMLYVPSW